MRPTSLGRRETPSSPFVERLSIPFHREACFSTYQHHVACCRSCFLPLSLCDHLQQPYECVRIYVYWCHALHSPLGWPSVVTRVVAPSPSSRYMSLIFHRAILSRMSLGTTAARQFSWNLRFLFIFARMGLSWSEVAWWDGGVEEMATSLKVPSGHYSNSTFVKADAKQIQDSGDFSHSALWGHDHPIPPRPHRRRGVRIPCGFLLLFV